MGSGGASPGDPGFLGIILSLNKPLTPIFLKRMPGEAYSRDTFRADPLQRGEEVGKPSNLFSITMPAASDWQAEEKPRLFDRANQPASDLR